MYSCYLLKTLLSFLSVFPETSVKSWNDSYMASSGLWEIKERVHTHAWGRRVRRWRIISEASMMVLVELARSSKTKWIRRMMVEGKKHQFCPWPSEDSLSSPPTWIIIKGCWDLFINSRKLQGCVLTHVSTNLGESSIFSIRAAFFLYSARAYC